MLISKLQQFFRSSPGRQGNRGWGGANQALAVYNGQGLQQGGGGEGRGGRGICYLAPSFSPTSEANDGMRLGILDNLCEVLHVGGAV